MVNKVKRLIRDYFGFSRVETNGFIVLFPMMTIMLLSPGIYGSLFSREYNPHEEDLALMDSLMTVWEGAVEIKAVKKPIKAEPIQILLRPFDPNTVTQEEMLTLGIPYFLTKRIDNYRNKGGRFKREKDLARIYDFPDSLYRVLAPYIALPEKSVPKGSEPAEVRKARLAGQKDRTEAVVKSHHKTEVLSIDLNKADTMVLKRLKGIGPSFSRRIVKYRKLLGGFANKEQLREVYGLSDSLYLSIADQVYVSKGDSTLTIALNIASFKTLSSHPYISYRAAREIIKLKSKRGKFRSLQDLMVVKELDSLQVMKLAPYLVF